jgi:surface-anchored protein
VWTVPLTQRPGVPWIGWNTQNPTLLAAASGDVTMTLDAVTGPGKLAVYAQDSFGGLGTRYFGTVEGFPRSTAVPVGQSGVHVHAVWAFTAPGAYTVTFAFTAAVDGKPATAKSTLAFHGGPGTPASTRPATEVVDRVGRTATGRECALDALADTGLDGTGVATLLLAAAFLVPLGLLLTGSAALSAARRGR